MLPSLLIRLLPDGAAEWLALGRDGRVLTGPQAGWPPQSAERVDVLVPAEDVLLLRAPRVARQRRQLEQAVPYAIEEQLAAPVEQAHVALGEDRGDDGIGVAVVARQRLDAWLRQLRAAGIEPDRIIPECALLPCEPGTAAVLIDGERATLRHAPDAAFAGQSRELPSWLALLAGEGRAPTRVRWIGAILSAPAGLVIEREEPGSLLRWFAAQPALAGAVNLLQGTYLPRRGRDGARRLWRWAAMLAAAALIAGFAQLVLERHALMRHHEDQRVQMEQLLRSAMPGITRIVDPRAQLAAEYARIGRGVEGGVLPLLARIAPTISGSGRYTLDGIEYRGDTLELVVRGPDVAALDSLREMLSAASLQVELTSAIPGSGGIEGRLRIRDGGKP
jgi:general secretion pathway protein L